MPGKRRTAPKQPARLPLVPLIKQADQPDLRLWRAVGATAELLQDAPLAAAALEAIQRLRPDFAEDAELLDLLARLNRLPIEPYLDVLRRDRADYIAKLGIGPIPGQPFENSLGMRFLPVAGTTVLFCIWETRVQDYRAYAEAKVEVNRAWEIIDPYRDGFATTAPVGSFPANPFGLYDLGGNVWEWCEDRYHPEMDFRVVRGGSWFNQEPRHLLSSARDHHLPGYRYDCYGFRVVLVTGPGH